MELGLFRSHYFTIKLFYSILLSHSFDCTILLSGRRTYDPWISLDTYLQPTKIGIDPYYDSYIDDGITCSRDCTTSPEPRTCYYKFTVENYSAMGPACDGCPSNRSACYNEQCVQADGIERMILTVNRRLPSQMIHVCLHDLIIVDLHNAMIDKALAIHWHGIIQRNYPYMDGVPFITQCPITEGQTFRYTFKADSLGTHFYHGHTGHQIVDGVLGPLIVRSHHKLEPYHDQFDFDLPSHTIIINDWVHSLTDNQYPGYNKDIGEHIITAQSYLINGRGSYFDTETNTDTGTPHAIFHVKYGYKYRFRVIAATSFTCGFKFAIEDHDMLVIAVDGNPSEPRKVGSIVMAGGDRIDFIIETKQEPKSYNIRIKGIEFCQNASQTAFLMYDDDAPTFNPYQNLNTDFEKVFRAPVFDYVQLGCIANAERECIDETRSYFTVPPRILNAKPDHIFFFDIGAHKFTHQELFNTNSFQRFHLPVGGPSVGGGMFSDTINNISCILPPFPLLTQDIPIPENLICPEECPSGLCYCLHLHKIPLNALVDIVVTENISTKDRRLNHPLHLHGNRFIIMKQGTLEDRQKSPEFWKNVSMPADPLVRDVVTLPGGGFVVLRFEATNPGFWLFHCHFNFHLLGGMFLVFQVGERYLEFPNIPADFPQCGNYEYSPIKPIDRLASNTNYNSLLNSDDHNFT